MPATLTRNSQSDDLSARFPSTTVVVASPTAAAETIIATLTIPNFGNLAVVSGVQVFGWAAYTVGTSGTAVTLKIRQTSVSGTTVVSTGALTKTAANLYTDDVQGVDTAPPTGGVYELTMQVTNGAAASTVSAVYLGAVIV